MRVWGIYLHTPARPGLAGERAQRHGLGGSAYIYGKTSTMTFRLYLLVSTDGHSLYPYVAVSDESDRIIQVATDHIKILTREDADFFETDYLLTSRTLDFDLAAMDKLVIDYIHIPEYSILIFFNEYKHMVLNYLSPNNESRKDYDIFDGYPEPRARKLVDEVYAMAVLLKEAVEL